MIPIQHQRTAFRYAVAFLSDEIQELETYLETSHQTESMEDMLKKRLIELKRDLSTLESYELHD